jgi:hypothetical protein
VTLAGSVIAFVKSHQQATVEQAIPCLAVVSVNSAADEAAKEASMLHACAVKALVIPAGGPRFQALYKGISLYGDVGLLRKIAAEELVTNMRARRDEPHALLQALIFGPDVYSKHLCPSLFKYCFWRGRIINLNESIVLYRLGAYRDPYHENLLGSPSCCPLCKGSFSSEGHAVHNLLVCQYAPVAHERMQWFQALEAFLRRVCDNRIYFREQHHQRMLVSDISSNDSVSLAQQYKYIFASNEFLMRKVSKKRRNTNSLACLALPSKRMFHWLRKACLRAAGDDDISHRSRVDAIYLEFQRLIAAGGISIIDLCVSLAYRRQSPC